MTIVGEEVGDRAPDYANGCKAISVRTLEPNVAAPWTIEAFRAGRSGDGRRLLQQQR